jgi:hypothetical protein
LVIDLASLTIDTPIPLLCSHDHGETIGLVSSASAEGGQLAISARLFADVDDDAAEIAAKADKGFPWQLSVGIWPDSVEEVQTGATVQLNGRTFTGPITVFRNSRVREVSVCALGADHRTSATVLSGEGDTVPVRFTTQEHPMKVEELQEQVAALKAQNEALAADNARLKADSEAREAQLAAERKAKREADIKALFSATGREFSEVSAQAYMDLSDAAFAAISADLSASAKRSAPEYLFSHVAVGGDEDGEAVKGGTVAKLDASTIYANRRKAAGV